MQGTDTHWSVSIDPSTGSQDELFVSGNRVVWFNGLDPACKVVKISYTMESNILQAFWCQFELAREEEDNGGDQGTCSHMYIPHSSHTCTHSCTCHPHTYTHTHMPHPTYSHTCPHMHSCLHSYITSSNIIVKDTKNEEEEDIETVRGVCVREQESITLFLQTGAVHYVSLPFQVTTLYYTAFSERFPFGVDSCTLYYIDCLVCTMMLW